MVAAVTALCGYGSFLFLNTLYLQDVRGFSALAAAVFSGPVLSGPVLSGPVLSGPVFSGPVFSGTGGSG